MKFICVLSGCGFCICMWVWKLCSWLNWWLVVSILLVGLVVGIGVVSDGFGVVGLVLCLYVFSSMMSRVVGNRCMRGEDMVGMVG